MNQQDIRNRMAEKGLKITPQRVAVMEAVLKRQNHPTAENLVEIIAKKNPNIATGTIYKILEIFVAEGLLKKVRTERGAARYDAIPEKHHHLYCAHSERIEDYYDRELDRMLKDYFDKKNIPDFNIHDIRLEITGSFSSPKIKQT